MAPVASFTRHWTWQQALRPSANAAEQPGLCDQRSGEMRAGGTLYDEDARG